MNMCYLHMLFTICIHTYIHSYVHTYINTYIHTYIHTYIRTYIHTYMHMHRYIHTYTHTYIHTYIHIYKKREWYCVICGRKTKTSKCLHFPIYYILMGCIRNKLQLRLSILYLSQLVRSLPLLDYPDFQHYSSHFTAH